MRKYLVLLTIIFSISGCNSTSRSEGVTIETENRYDTVRGKIMLSGQIIRSFRSSDKVLLAERIKINNYNDDRKLIVLTGLTKMHGLSEYLLDSLSYDQSGNMTLKKSYVKSKGQWVQKHYFQNTYRPDNQILHFKTERLNDSNVFSRQVFYHYNNQDKLISETEYMCSTYHPCDSLSKKQYFYNLQGKPDSTLFYIWSGKKWIFRRMVDKTKNGM